MAMTEHEFMARVRCDGGFDTLRDYFRRLGWLDADAVVRELHDAAENREDEIDWYGEYEGDYLREMCAGDVGVDVVPQ